MTTGRGNQWSADRVDLAILAGVSGGETLEAVARGLGISERTVRRRLRSLAEEIGVETTIEVVVHAVRHGVL